MSDYITHETSIVFGMMVGRNVPEVQAQIVEDKKREVAESLERIGFRVLSQVYEPECEWGRIITRAESINPKTSCSMIKDGERIIIEHGYFYDARKQCKFLMRILREGRNLKDFLAFLKDDDNESGSLQ